MGSLEEQVKSDLLETLTEHSGLPREILEEEIQTILAETGSDIHDLSLEKLRFILLKYLNKLEKETN